MSVRLLTATVAALTAGLIGCGTPPPRTVEHPNVAIATGAPHTPAVPAAAQTPPPPQIADGAAVPVASLLDLARRTTPTRALFEANRAAAAAAISQAGAWANPEVEFGIGRARAREADESGTRTSTTIGGVRLSQRFELPGKRSSRIAAAEAGRTLADRSAAVDASPCGPRLEASGRPMQRRVSLCRTYRAVSWTWALRVTCWRQTTR